MSETTKGILAMIGACTIWGLSPIYYKLLAHIPAPEVMAHRITWSLVFFAGVLAVQGRLPVLRAAFSGGRRIATIVLASAMISTNWFLFIFATQIGRNTETSLGYYIFPLVAVLLGRFVLGERLGRIQWGAIALAFAGVSVLTVGLGVAPYISLALAVTFGLYGLIKNGLPLGPVVSVTAEVAVVAPFALALLAARHGGIYGEGAGAFGASLQDSLLLMLSGPLTASPLILFSAAARRVAMSTVGVLQYINPTLQFLCAVILFGEAFSPVHQAAFALIWAAVALYSLGAFRQDRAARRAAMAASGSSTQVR
ncbi:EamA family transporter RarD [Cribrihabitans sp. XS_ASV171]